MEIKKGASIRGLRPEMVLGCQIIDRVLEDKFKYLFTITCGTDGEHGEGSLHYVGLAIDARVRHIPKSLLDQITTALADKLGEEFDVVLEATHWHIEYQPKNPA